MEQLDLFDGVMVVNPIIFIIDIIIILHFFTQWYFDYRQTGWKLNYWHLGIFMSLIVPFCVMYPFAASSLNVISTGDAYVKISKYTDDAFVITMTGYAAMILGAWLAKKKIIYQDNKSFMEKIVYTSLGGKFGIRIWSIICVIFFMIVGILSINWGMSFNARGWFLTHPQYRFIGNFFSSVYPMITTYIGLRFLNGYRSKIDIVMAAMLLLSGIFWGSRGMLFYPFLMSFIYWLYIHKEISLIKIVFVGFIVVTGIIFMGIIRSGVDIGNASLLSEMILANLFYGNTFSDCRDFAWILSGFSYDDYKFGSTYISGLFSFLPSSMFEWRRDYAIGPLTLEYAGLNNLDGEHPGLRGGLFFEIFLNFGEIGVLIWGWIIGYLSKRADLWTRYYIDVKCDVVNAYTKTVPYILVSYLSLTAGMFGLYVFVLYHLSSMLLNMIPLYLNNKLNG